MSEEVLKCCFDLLGITVIKKNFKCPTLNGLLAPSKTPKRWFVFIRENMKQDKTVMVMLHELAHIYLHYDKGNIIKQYNEEYEKQADRAAAMAFDLLHIVFALGGELEE